MIEIALPLSESFVTSFWRRVQVSKPDSCWEWLGGLFSEGYGAVFLEGNNRLTHRVAFAIENGFWPQNALHRCDNKPCCNPGHLFDGSLEDNNLDMIAKGRDRQKGEANGACKYPDDLIRQIRFSMMSSRQAARAFGISQTQACRIIGGRARRNII